MPRIHSLVQAKLPTNKWQVPYYSTVGGIPIHPITPV